jgi:hypothetical protein
VYWLCLRGIWTLLFWFLGFFIKVGRNLWLLESIAHSSLRTEQSALILKDNDV